jgi:hypothetical protein
LRSLGLERDADSGDAQRPGVTGQQADQEAEHAVGGRSLGDASRANSGLRVFQHQMMYHNAQHRPSCRSCTEEQLQESTRIRHEQADVDGRLASLALKAEWLRESVRLGLADGAQCTANDPLILPSFVNWGKTVGYLRDHLLPHGWQRSRRSGYEITISPSGRVALAVAAGDEGTGVRTIPVRTRTPKGPATFAAILSNTGMRNVEISDLIDSFPKGNPLPKEQTWILLFFADNAKDEIRLELSLPTGVAADGQVTVWGERLILKPITWSGPGTYELTDDGDLPDGPEIRVERR